MSEHLTPEDRDRLRALATDGACARAMPEVWLPMSRTTNPYKEDPR